MEALVSSSSGGGSGPSAAPRTLGRCRWRRGTVCSSLDRLGGDDATRVNLGAWAVERCLESLSPQVTAFDLQQQLGISVPASWAALRRVSEAANVLAPARELDFVVTSDGSEQAQPGRRVVRVMPEAAIDTALATLRPGSCHVQVYAVRLTAASPSSACALRWRTELEARWEAYRHRRPGPDGPAERLPTPPAKRPHRDIDADVLNIVDDDDDECHMILSS